MEPELVTLQLPSQLYEKLQRLANESQTDPVNVISNLVKTAYQKRDWLRDLNALRQQIQEDGGLQVGQTKEEIVAKLRQTREEIFETEYANLYR
jgi:predicted transcriptional regulator